MPENWTAPTEFILIGLSEVSNIQIWIFIVLLSIYVVTLLGNICIIVAYVFSADLNTPMYFFLANFSFLDMCYISVNVPKMLSISLTDHKSISFYGCALQVYSFGVCGGTECYVLAAMAYDRYNAICNPLLYSVIMNGGICLQFILGSYLIGSVNSLLHTSLTFTLPFCGPNIINHIFCDIPPILRLACTDTRVNQIVIFVTSTSVVVVSFILILISYTYIIKAIIRINTTSGKIKAFSTCTSHLTVVTIFYGSAMFMYLKPESDATNQDNLVAVMYTVITPLLNPFIYSLRNSNVKLALIRMYHQFKSNNQY